MAISNEELPKTTYEKGIIQSMPRNGNRLDNKVVENLFGLLRLKLLYLQDFESVEHFKQELNVFFVKLKSNSI